MVSDVWISWNSGLIKITFFSQGFNIFRHKISVFLMMLVYPISILFHPRKRIFLNTFFFIKSNTHTNIHWT